MAASRPGSSSSTARTPARDVRDLGEEPRAEEQERLGRLAQRQRPALRLDAVLAAERLGLLQVLLASGTAHGVEVADEEIAHAHPALAEPAQRGLIEARMPVLLRHVGAHALEELGGDAILRLAHRRERLARALSRARE